MSKEVGHVEDRWPFGEISLCTQIFLSDPSSGYELRSHAEGGQTLKWRPFAISNVAPYSVSDYCFAHMPAVEKVLQHKVLVIGS